MIFVKGLNWIGDAVMSLPFFESLKKGNPEKSICVAARPWVAEVYKNCSYVDEVIEIDDKKKKWIFIKNLRRKKFEYGILLPKSLSSAIFCRFGGIKKLHGWNTQNRGVFLREKYELSQDIKKKHQVFLHLKLAEYNKGKVLKNPSLKFNTQNSVDINVEEKWLSNKNKYFGINAGAAFGPAKRWFPKNFADVIEYFQEKYNLIPVFVGSEKEKSIGKSIISELNSKVVYLNLMGKTSLQELFSIINKCSLFLTNDSGPMHIAAAFDIPQVAIFGSTNPITTGPFSSKSLVVQSSEKCAPCLKKVCKFGTYSCMKNITSEMVINKLEECIELCQLNLD